MPNAARGTFWKGTSGTSQSNSNSFNPVAQKCFSAVRAPHQAAEIVVASNCHESTHAFGFDFVVPCLRQKLFFRSGPA